MLCIWLSHLERSSSKLLTFNIKKALFCHQRRHKSLFGDEELLIAWDYFVIYLVGTQDCYHPSFPAVRSFPNSKHQVVCVMIDLSAPFIYILCFFWWLAWCATLCFVNGFRPRVAANDMVVIVCQCDNVWFPISMWSWTFDEGGILSGRQSAVICHQLNELLSSLGFRWRCYFHRPFFGLLPWFLHDLAHCINEPRLRSNQQWDKSFIESLSLCSVLTYKNLLTVFHGKTEVKLQSVVIFYS